MVNKISIVFTARNDDYGGDLLDRINLLLSSLDHATSKLKKKIEVIIVEYNPPKDKELLYKVLKISKNKFLNVKFIEFPPILHQKYFNSKKISMFEYSAKNIGIRRATGEYIVSTNQDIIFSPEIIEYLVTAKLNKDTFYRVDRLDVHLSKKIFRRNIKEVLDYCQLNKYLRKSKYGDIFIKYFSMHSILAILRNILYKLLFDNPVLNRTDKGSTKWPANLHLFAAGDFLMMHKDAWKLLRGYSESKEGNNFLDSLILFEANKEDMKQVIINHAIYHIDHQMDKLGRPSISLGEFKKRVNTVMSNKQNLKRKSVNWGENKLKLDMVNFN